MVPVVFEAGPLEVERAAEPVLLKEVTSAVALLDEFDAEVPADVERTDVLGSFGVIIVDVLVVFKAGPPGVVVPFVVGNGGDPPLV